MPKLILKVIVVLISGLFFGAIGLFLGATIGGNYTQNFALFGVRGYEAAGQLGFILGAIMGVVVSLSLFRNRSKS